MTRITASLKAFREPDIIVKDLLDIGSDFNAADSRRLRYQIYWSFYENSAYDSIHKWASAYKNKHELYKHIRNIYNPANVICSFWKQHLWGDLEPLTEDETLKENIQTVFLTSTKWRALPKIVKNGAAFMQKRATIGPFF